MTPAVFASSKPRVVVSNVTRNNAYPIIEAAHDAGYLERFITSVYYKPSTLTGKLGYRASGVLGDKARKQVLGRRTDGVPDERVCALPASEVFEQLAARALERTGNDPRPPTYLKNAWFDLAASRHIPSCDIFHGFEQCALHSMRRAHKLGAVTVLEQPQLHIDAVLELERRECEQLGMPIPARPIGFDTHVERKYLEYREADYIVAGLDLMKRTFVERGFDPSRIFVVPYGADLGGFRQVDRSARDTFEILYVGPLFYWKGLHYLLDAFQGLDVPNARLTVLGRGDPDWTTFYKSRMQALGDRVRYIPGVPQSEIPSFYAEADVLAFPSLIGGVGIVCYEAMATGLPLITSEADVILTHEKDALCIDPRDPLAWREALRKLAKEKSFRLELGRRGRETVLRYTWDDYRKRVIATYDDIWQRTRAERR